MNKQAKQKLKKLKREFLEFGYKCFRVLYVPIVTLFTHVRKNQILFICFKGEQYGDNLTPVSEQLHKINPKLKIIYLFTDAKKMKKILPSYIKCVQKNPFTLTHYLATSSVWVDNDHLVYRNRIRKKKNQLFIETWHGDRGLKKCFYSIERYKSPTPFATEINGYCDYIVTGSTFAEKIEKTMFRYNGEFLKCGQPRNDILFNNDEELKKTIKNKLGVKEEVKLLLYAPTFRKNYSKKVETLNFNNLISTLEKRDNKKWAIISRVHHKLIKKGKNTNFGNVQILDGNNNLDMSELIYVSDMLITDYSSCYGDFILTGKPAILYIDDYDKYINEDRGLHFDIENTPFLFAKTNDELINIVKNLTDEKAKENCKDVYNFYGCYENGHASETICKVINNHINKGVK